MGGAGPPDGASPDWLSVVIKEVPYVPAGVQEKDTLKHVQEGLAHCIDSCHVTQQIESFEGLSVVDGSKVLFPLSPGEHFCLEARCTHQYLFGIMVLC